MSRAPLVPAFSPGAPVSVLVDYDGTVSRRDIGDVLLERHALVERAAVVAKDADYDAGRAGSRELMQWDMEVLPRDGDLLRAVAAAIPQDVAHLGSTVTPPSISKLEGGLKGRTHITSMWSGAAGPDRPTRTAP